MKVAEALDRRYTCRVFKPDPLSRETINGILEAALRTPSWANTQPWELFVAGGEALERIRAGYLEHFHKGVPRNPDLPPPQGWPAALKSRMEQLGTKRLEALGIDPGDSAARRALGEQNFRLFGAPVVVYLCMDRTLSPWSLFDMGSLAQSIMLAAQQYGVDSAPAVMLAAYPDLLRAQLGIPCDLSILLGVALGIGDSGHLYNSYRSPRRPLQEVARFIDL